MYDLIVVGGGPAGLTAAIYAIRKRMDVLLVSMDLGGKTNFRLELPWIEDYQVITGLEIITKFRRELEYLNFARNMEAVERITVQDNHFVVHTRGGGELTSRTVIVATGTKQKRLDVPGEKEFIMRGLCYSAQSYAPLFIDKTTIVIGDGALALRSAAELATVAKLVYLVGPSGRILETALGEKLRSAPNVNILERHKVSSVLGNGYADRVVVEGPDGQELELAADGTFIEEALMPNSAPVAALVELDELGRIQVDSFNRTSVPGVFAAGDVTTTYAEQVLVAIGEGAKAALSAYHYLLPSL